MTPETALRMQLQAANRERELAAQDCPHWDYEDGVVGSDDGFHDCCYRLSDAQERLRGLRRKWKCISQAN
jgi:hypothetical protein